jgi:hypothetical protein
MNMSSKIGCVVAIIFQCALRGLQVHNLIYEDSFVLGEKKTFEIGVTNEQDEPVEISLSQYDYEPLDKGGGGEYKDVGSVKKSNASWITLPYPRIVLKPKEYKKITCQLSIPKDASLNSSYWSRIMIEPEDTKMPTEKKEGLTLINKVRYSVLVMTHVGNTNAKMKLVGKGVEKVGDQEYLYVELKNLGNFYLRPKIKLKLFGPEGKLDNTLTGNVASFYPGFTNRYRIPIQDVKKKDYKVFFVLERENAEPIADTFDISIK